MPPEKMCSPAQGGELGVPIVVDFDGEEIRSRGQRVTNIDEEAGVSAIVMAGVLAVDEDVGDLESAFEFEEDSFREPIFCDVDLFSVPADTDIKIGGAEVGEVEGVGEVDGLPVGVVEIALGGAGVVAEEKSPLAVEIEADARRIHF